MALVVYQGPSNINDDSVNQTDSSAEKRRVAKLNRFSGTSVNRNSSIEYYDRREDFVGLVMYTHFI